MSAICISSDLFYFISYNFFFLICWFCIAVATVIFIAAADVADDADVVVVNSWMEDTS